jgi:hypothetical protein
MKMTKEQTADALLEAARRWQNGKISDDTTAFWTDANSDAWFMILAEEYSVDEGGQPWGTILGSAALSEVAGMGFDIVNHDGTDCEKVRVPR